MSQNYPSKSPDVRDGRGTFLRSGPFESRSAHSLLSLELAIYARGEIGIRSAMSFSNVRK